MCCALFSFQFMLLQLQQQEQQSYWRQLQLQHMPALGHRYQSRSACETLSAIAKSNKQRASMEIFGNYKKPVAIAANFL